MTEQRLRNEQSSSARRYGLSMTQASTMKAGSVAIARTRPTQGVFVTKELGEVAADASDVRLQVSVRTSTVIQKSARRDIGLLGQEASQPTRSERVLYQSRVIGTSTVDSPLHPLTQLELLDSSYADMLLTEEVLSRDWDSPEDNEAWADL
jgi:hypothetical protein